MYTQRRFIPCIIRAWIILLGAASYLYGQSPLSYKGPLRLGEFEGTANYSYEEVEGDTLLEGPFSLRSPGLNALSSEGNSFFSFQGSFDQGQFDSSWQFRFGEFFPEQGTEWINFFVRVKVSGIQHTAIIPFQQGVPEGEWIHHIDYIENSAVNKTLFKSQVPFDKGLAHGTFRIEKDSLIFLGRFLRNGLAHDIWELSIEGDAERVERWHFSQGWLKKIEVQYIDGFDSLKVFQDIPGTEKLVNLDDRYVKILEIQSLFDRSRYVTSGGIASQLIEENASYYRQVAKALNSFDDFEIPFSKPSLGVKVAYFPLPPEERQQVEDIWNYVRKIQASKQALQENTRLNLLKHSDEEILFLLSAVEEITQNYLHPAKEIASYLEEDIIEYFPIEHLALPTKEMSHILNGIEVSFQDSSGIKTRTFRGPSAPPLGSQGKGYGYLAGLTSYVWQCIDSIEQRLNNNLREQRLQQELEEIEKALIASEKRLVYVIDSLGPLLPATYQASLRALTSTSDHIIRQYNLEEDLANKPDLATELIDCIRELEQLGIGLSKLPERREEIQELYTEQVWNPFTATIMTDQVKGRIIEAYDELLIPFLMKSLQSELTCGNIEVYQETLNKAYERMCQLRKQNTGKLERKLKKEDDPKMVMQLFEISL